MRVLMVSAEMAPLVKVGGLADVVGALGPALAARGHQVKVVLPLYGHLDREAMGLAPDPGLGPVPLRVDQTVMSVRYWRAPSPVANLDIYLAACDPLFGRAGVYADATGHGFSDSLERASCLAQAALALPEQLDWPVDVLHAHDAQAALVPVYRRRWHAGRELPGRAATMLTIHNLAHQDIHGADWVQRTGLPATLVQYPGPFEFYGHFNLLKGGIVDADIVSTVSPTYAREVVDDPQYGCGLEGVLAARKDDFIGILNGADYTTWDPRRDARIAARYDRRDLAGKAACKRQLVTELGLDGQARPLLGMVSRLVAQKGLDLLLPLVDRIVAGGFSLVVLGTGDAVFMQNLQECARRHPHRVVLSTAFDEDLAHAIYAGADLFLMPSQFEPCGLSQMYALRYGTLPVVRRTGGLADTVVDAAEAGGTGFVFAGYDIESFWGALERARAAFADRTAWTALQARGMDLDFSWDVAARHYEGAFARLMGRT